MLASNCCLQKTVTYVFSGKMLNCKPESLAFCESQLDDDDDNELIRASRLLAVPLGQLRLCQNATTYNVTSTWGFAGYTPLHRLGCALRAALRDVGHRDAAAKKAVREASNLLITRIQETPGWDNNSSDVDVSSEIGYSPEQMLRFGALGGRVAAATVSAMNPLNSEERQAGLES